MPSFSSFADELCFIKSAGLRKEAIGLAAFNAAKGVIAKRVGPGGVTQTMRAAAPKKPARLGQTMRGQKVPGLAKEQANFKAVGSANKALSGAQSIL